MILTLTASQLEEYESQGLVADSLAIRQALINKVKEGMLSLSQAKQMLKAIQKQAHGNGLYTREDFHSNKPVDLANTIEKKRLRDLKRLNRELNKTYFKNVGNVKKHKL